MKSKGGLERLRVLDFSDIHFGHPNTPTSYIILNLDKALSDPAILRDVDILFLSGDIFDRQLDLNDPNVYLIREWIVRTIRKCKQYDIALRVLYGTPSHDARQSMLFEHLNKLCEIGADVKYISELSIEYMERYEVHVLYVPDRSRPSNSIAWRDVRRLLDLYKLEAVDIGIMHGFFDFQLPEIARNSTDHHISDEYLKIVKHVIFNGHDHKPQQKGHIYIPGSFDRLRHGEEEAKGHLDAVITPKDLVVTFVENKTAMPHVTLRLPDVDTKLEEVVDEILAKVGNVKKAFIRIITTRNSAIYHSGEKLKQVFPLFHFTFEEPSRAKEKSIGAIPRIIESTTRLSHVSLTKNNLRDELLSRVEVRDPSVLELAKKLIHGVLNDESKIRSK